MRARMQRMRDVDEASCVPRYVTCARNVALACTTVLRTSVEILVVLCTCSALGFGEANV